VAGSAPVQSAGVEESVHDDAFADEKLKTTEPPVDGTLPGEIESVAVGEVEAGGGGGGGDGDGDGRGGAAAWLSVTLR
jgi:hypothetical protein